MALISVYSDGSSGSNSKSAIGWGFVVVSDNMVLASGCGGAAIGSNNAAELTGAISGLQAVIEKNINVSDGIELVSDSRYVLGISSGEYEPRKNLELACSLRKLSIQLDIKTRWVQGHSGDKCNTICDTLAKFARDSYMPKVDGTRKAERKRRRELVRKVLK